MQLRDHVCVVIGAGSGIGRETALMLADEGAVPILIGRTATKLSDVKNEILRQGGHSRIFDLDVGDHSAVQDMAETVLEEFGRVDLLVNNAGHSSPNRRLLTSTPSEIQSVLSSNLLGTIFCTQAVIPSMLKAQRGTIINIASVAGVNPSLLAGLAYSAAKAAVINFTGFLNKDLENTGIRSSVVIPGEVDTPILDNRPTPPSRDARDTMVTAEDTANAILMIVKLPQRANIPELQIRPTYVRDLSAEIESASNS